MPALIYEKRGHIAYLTLNRPEAMNAMNHEMYQQLSESWIEVRDDYDVWVAIITGAGERSFSTGADLKTFIPNVEGDVGKAKLWQTQADNLLNRGLEVWKPVIAAVNGYCVAGGMTLLMATDIRVAAEHAQFGVAEVKRGILPGNGGTQRIIRQLPYPIAMELLLIGDRIDAQTALRYGLLNRVVPKEKLLETAEEYASRLSENAPLAVRAIKELAVRGTNMALPDALRMEEAMSHILRSTEDAQEGPKAFAEKRKAVFKGR
ncbi:MAG: enoyl-CoA hydratase/isomerase family protein [Candidatus Lambdaproteobacteria bacterium]|nr:enoyl-CoA hydratase/isomerase family protein [Candidatus Lambdaproteobacteria bacterium]